MFVTVNIAFHPILKMLSALNSVNHNIWNQRFINCFLLWWLKHPFFSTEHWSHVRFEYWLLYKWWLQLLQISVILLNYDFVFPLIRDSMRSIWIIPVTRVPVREGMICIWLSGQYSGNTWDIRGRLSLLAGVLCKQFYKYEPAMSNLSIFESIRLERQKSSLKGHKLEIRTWWAHRFTVAL